MAHSIFSSSTAFLHLHKSTGKNQWVWLTWQPLCLWDCGMHRQKVCIPLYTRVWNYNKPYKQKSHHIDQNLHGFLQWLWLWVGEKVHKMITLKGQWVIGVRVGYVACIMIHCHRVIFKPQYPICCWHWQKDWTDQDKEQERRFFFFPGQPKRLIVWVSGLVMNSPEFGANFKTRSLSLPTAEQRKLRVCARGVMRFQDRADRKFKKERRYFLRAEEMKGGDRWQSGGRKCVCHGQMCLLSVWVYRECEWGGQEDTHSTWDRIIIMRA